MLAEDKFMPEFHLRQQVFTYNACKSFTKYHDWIQKLKETGDIKDLHWNELDKASFTHDTAYSGSKVLSKRTFLDKFLKYRAYEAVRNPNFDGYQRGLASMVYRFFDKKTGLVASVKVT